jgi:hypothetical protein
VASSSPRDEWPGEAAGGETFPARRGKDYFVSSTAWISFQPPTWSAYLS